MNRIDTKTVEVLFHPGRLLDVVPKCENLPKYETAGFFESSLRHTANAALTFGARAVSPLAAAFAVGTDWKQQGGVKYALCPLGALGGAGLAAVWAIPGLLYSTAATAVCLLGTAAGGLSVTTEMAMDGIVNLAAAPEELQAS